MSSVKENDSKLIKCWLCLIKTGKELNTDNHMLMPTIESEYYNYSICNNCRSHLFELYETQFKEKKHYISSKIQAYETSDYGSQDVDTIMELTQELEEDKLLYYYRRQLRYNMDPSLVENALESSIKNGTRHSDDYIFSIIEKYKLDADFNISIFMALIEFSIPIYDMVNNDINVLRLIALSNLKRKELDISLFGHKIKENDELIKFVTFEYENINPTDSQKNSLETQKNPFEQAFRDYKSK